MLTNTEVKRAFSLYAELLQLHQQDERMADLLQGAAYRIGRLEKNVTAMETAELNQLFRPQIVKLIKSLGGTATIEALEELIQLTPPGLFDMMRIRGLGGKKLAVIWKKAKIDTVEGLLKACKANKLSSIAGFGAKTEKNIIAAIEAMNSNSTLFHYADVAGTAEALVTAFRRIFKGAHVELCGEVRRQTTTVGAIEILAAVPSAKLKAAALKKIITIQSSTPVLTSAHTLDEIPVTIYHCTPGNFIHQLFEKTGNAAHVAKINSRLKGKASFNSEKDLYKSARLPFIPPEMREDVAEWSYSRKPEDLITLQDIKGVVHNHTNWSDGVDKLEAFVNACIRKKYEYAVISDHSQNAHYAGGLKPDKVLRQLQAIDDLNKTVKPFKIFKSIECDILVSGELDYTPALLKKFDLVIVSIHQLLKMDEAKATARLIKAIENPYTTILGHMTGRQLLIRPGYPVNFKKVIDACAANKVIIEINANPYRLDMDWSHIPYALQKGVMISINPDAHSIREIDNIRWGVSAARKGGLTTGMTWNAMSLEEINRWLKKKKKN